MKKEESEKELIAVLQEAKELLKKSQLELDTSQFLKNEAYKLMMKFEDPNTPTNEKEKITKQMVILQKRMESEIKMSEKDNQKVTILENKLKELESTFPNNLLE